jgi:hypothetical protein
MHLIPDRTKVLACATVIEELLPLLPTGMIHETLDFGLHIRPAMLRQILQEAIDATPPMSRPSSSAMAFVLRLWPGCGPIAPQ